MRELKKEEIKQVIEGCGHTCRTPMLYDLWIYPWIYGERRGEFESFMDAQIKDVDFVDLVNRKTFRRQRMLRIINGLTEKCLKKQGWALTQIA